MCKAEIQKHMETKEQYWAREVIWAVRKIKSDNLPVNRTAIQRLTNMRKENLQACIPHISDKEIQKQIKSLI